MRILCVLLLSIAPSLLIAHPGHDHSHWLSGAVHSVLAFVILAAIAVGVISVLKSKSIKLPFGKSKGN